MDVLWEGENFMLDIILEGKIIFMDVYGVVIRSRLYINEYLWGIKEEWSCLGYNFKIRWSKMSLERMLINCGSIMREVGGIIMS